MADVTAALAQRHGSVLKGHAQERARQALVCYSEFCLKGDIIPGTNCLGTRGLSDQSLSL